MVQRRVGQGLWRAVVWGVAVEEQGGLWADDKAAFDCDGGDDYVGDWDY